MSRFKVISHLNAQPQQGCKDNLVGLVLDISNDPIRDTTILKTGFGRKSFHPWIAADLGYDNTIITPTEPLGGVDRLFVGTRRSLREPNEFELFTEVFNNDDTEVPEKSRKQLDNIGRALAIVTLRLCKVDKSGDYTFTLDSTELSDVDSHITKWLRD